ncbi:hypothetical protein R6G99_05730, partial [Actinotignum timonense]|nr:hypothetical protein [Actinotignum timonense]
HRNGGGIHGGKLSHRGGGLGAMAQNAGYYNNRPDVLTIVVIVLVLLVMVIQALGDMLSRLVDHR